MLKNVLISPNMRQICIARTSQRCDFVLVTFRLIFNVKDYDLTIP